MPRMRRATRGLSATSSGGSFSAAEATTLGGSSGEKMRGLAALSTGSVQAAAASTKAAMSVDLLRPLTDPPADGLRKLCGAYGGGKRPLRSAVQGIESHTHMQNLRDKLLKAGLVSEDQAKTAE